MIKLFVYALSLIVSTFAISGINFDNLIKKNHVWEARFLGMLMVIALAYLIANFILDASHITILN